jgi:hypothetical protein
MSNDSQPPPLAPIGQTKSRRLIIAGFITGAVPWLLTLLPQKNYGQIPFLIVACFIVPVLAGILALVRKTRKFGLGLLLACGLGWLVLGAICGGVFR